MWQAIICSGRHLSPSTANLSLNFIWLKMSEWAEADGHTHAHTHTYSSCSVQYQSPSHNKKKTLKKLHCRSHYCLPALIFCQNSDVLKSRIHTSDKRRRSHFPLICFRFLCCRALCVHFLHGHGCLSRGEKSASVFAILPRGVLGNGISSSSRKTPPSSTWREKGRELPSSKVRSAASNTLTRNFPAVTFWILVVQSCRLMEDLQRFQLLNALVPGTIKTTQ